MLNIVVLAKKHALLSNEGSLQHDNTSFVEKILFADGCTLQPFLNYVV